jgi:hypothetical protein
LDGAQGSRIHFNPEEKSKSQGCTAPQYNREFLASPIPPNFKEGHTMHTITATLTKDRNGKPIAVIDGLPGDGAEFDSEDAAKIGFAMTAISSRLLDGMEGRQEYTFRKE